MDERNFVECLKCGTIHHVISEKEAKALKKAKDGFSARNLTHCFKCGSKDSFSIISEMHVGYYGISDKIPPVLADYEKLEKAYEATHKY